MLTFEVFYDSKSFVHIKAFKNSSCKFVTVFFSLWTGWFQMFSDSYVTSNCFHFIDILSFHGNNYEYHLNMWVTVSLTELCTFTCILNSILFLLMYIILQCLCKRIGGMTTTWLWTGHFHLKTTLYWHRWEGEEYTVGFQTEGSWVRA